jgi:fructose-1,6-bisphosphatase/inositol monophosphatase family enzyme
MYGHRRCNQDSDPGDPLMSELLSEKLQQQFLVFGDSLIERTRQLILPLWKGGSIQSELKEDKTPVSEVDLKCEELARELIRKQFPDHGIIGEEYGVERGDAEFVWTVDPIDGTQNLINRIPTFGTIVGLLHRGQPILGWIDHPVLGDTLRGGPTTGAFHNGKRVHLEDLQTNSLTPNDVIATNCPATFDRGGHLDVLSKVLKFHPHVRMYYDVYSHTLTILGSLALMVEYNLKIWDLAATQALIEGAGGVYQQLGSDEVPGSATLYHAAFGKKRAVALVSEAILVSE